jgi:argininosuccinate lyase
VFSVLSVDRSVQSRVSEGGTAPKNVRREAQRWLNRLDRERRTIDESRAGGFTPGPVRA